MDGDVTLIENSKLASVLKDLLSTKEENVEKALLYRTVVTGRDVIEKQHTVQEASYGRDALAKVFSFCRSVLPNLTSVIHLTLIQAGVSHSAMTFRSGRALWRCDVCGQGQGHCCWAFGH